MSSATLKSIALTDWHRTAGAKMVPFAGFDMPVRYSSDIEEHLAVRRAAGLFDVSHMGEFMVEGPAALDLVQAIATNDASTLKDGRVQYSCMTNEDGGIVDDLLVYRFNDQRYMLVVNAGNLEKDWQWINHVNTSRGINAQLTDLSDDYSLFALQGPAAQAILQPITNLRLELEYYSFGIGAIAGTDCIISATGYTGAGGFEIYVPRHASLPVWESIMEAGKGHGLKLCGLGARDTLRLEMGFCLYGNDITDETSPLEAGLGWITKLNHPFTAVEKLVNQKEIGPLRKLVGFKMEDRGIPRQGYEIYDADGTLIGTVTSGTQSPSLGYGIGMGYLPANLTKAGTEIFIDVRGRKLKAQIVRPPFLPKNIQNS